ncbi:type IV toxin-antitoxin system AbiEi family antitoxin domain-containing protein [Candidatus Sumerlaeota bacterium]|nr:type IV toxin-antitoxin system AbiEi family antitoxin domain-containing protein [Candidatus Sumerlaeota bacterium]
MTLTAKEYKPGLGKREASLIAVLAERNKALFTAQDAKALAGHDAKEVVRWLVRKKWVLPLKRGLYAIVPLDVGLKGADAFVVHNFVVASMLVRPYYVGFWSALNHHGLTDQIPRTTFVATTRARHAVTVLDSEYCFVKLARRKFFGWQEVQIEGRKVRISDLEKTVADCLDHPKHCGGIEQVARAIYFSHDEFDLKRVVRYAKHMGNGAILKRLGHILEATGLLPQYERLFAGFKPSAGFPKLDTLSPPTGKHDGRWRLLVNYRLDPEGWRY